MQIRPDTWALDAHLQPESVAVAVGDELSVAGQRLPRRSGNSGNSIAPHLHFGLLDGPDPRTANSLPFVLGHYTMSGAVDPASYRAAFAGTGPLELRTERHTREPVRHSAAQPRRHRLPPNSTSTG